MFNSFKEDSIYARLVNEARYLNMTVMFIVQSSLSIPAVLREGAAIVFCKRVNDKKETRILSDILNLTSKEQSDILIYLKQCDGIFINKEMGSVPVSIVNCAYPSRRVTRKKIFEYQEFYAQRILEGILRKTNKPCTSAENKKEEIDYNTNLLMNDLVRFPFDFQVERSVRLNINASTLSKCLTVGVELGLIKKSNDKINLGKGKSPFQPYLLTDKGIKRFGKQRIRGKGSLNHAFWQYRCAKYFLERKYIVEIEKYLDDKLSSVDVVANKERERIAIEIELNQTEHIRHNILKCLNAEFDLIVIGVYGSSMLKYVERILLTDLHIEERYKKGKIEVRMLPEFLDSGSF